MTPKSQAHRLLRFNLIARCQALVACTATCLLGWFVPVSLTAKLLAEGGSYGRLTLVILTICLVLGWLDVLINDFMPERYSFVAVLKRRHRLFYILAGLYLIEAYVGFGDTLGAEDLLSFIYILNAGTAFWYSWAVSIRAGDV